MTDVLYLAWRYLAYHKVKTFVLIAALAIIVYLPAGLNIVVSQSAKELTARARSTPLLIGDKGSRLERVLNALYFESKSPASTRYAELARVEETGFAQAIPLHTRFRAGPGPNGAWYPVVGTTLEYFEFRGLRNAEGRKMAMIGECVLGARAAEAARVDPVNYVVSKSEGVFDIAGVYPLKMRVVGVLESTGTPDDHAVFIDLKTAWVIEGLGHGHQDLTRPEAVDGVLRTDGNTIIANRSVQEFTEVTPENVENFHFHGEMANFPITSVIAVPHDRKSSDLLQGRYLSDDAAVQIIRPRDVMDDLLGTIFTVRGYVMIGIIVLGIATIATMILVFVLSLQLRRREMETMQRIGGSSGRIRALVAVEILSVLVAGIMVAAMLAALTLWFAPATTRLLFLFS